jgi:hypothetical protein
MTQTIRTILNKDELEAEIMSRMRAIPECADIAHVQVKSTRLHPPQPTWEAYAVERSTSIPGTPKYNPFMYSVLNDMRKAFDLLPE